MKERIPNYANRARIGINITNIVTLCISEITFDFTQCVRILIPLTNTSQPTFLQDAQRALRRIRGR